MNRGRPGAHTSAENGDERLRGARLAVPFARVWSAALATAHLTPRWKVTEHDSSSGRIVAEATTPVCRFVDDVVIQLSLDDEGFTRVDLTSHSRVGRYDFGTNARRIRAYLRRLRKSLPPG